MYTLGVVLTVVGGIGIIVTIIWTILDNNKKNKQSYIKKISTKL